MEAIIGLVVVVIGLIAAALGIQHKAGRAKEANEHMQSQIEQAKVASKARDAIRRDRDERERVRDKYQRD